MTTFASRSSPTSSMVTYRDADDRTGWIQMKPGRQFAIRDFRPSHSQTHRKVVLQKPLLPQPSITPWLSDTFGILFLLSINCLRVVTSLSGPPVEGWKTTYELERSLSFSRFYFGQGLRLFTVTCNLWCTRGKDSWLMFTRFLLEFC